MKNNWKTKKCFLFFGIIFFLSLAIFYNFNSNESTNSEDSYINNKINLKTAGYWDLTGTPIDIDDTDITKNWSYTASTYDWCSGSGTWNDPYLIENVTIDGQGTVTCLTILHSKTAYFVIRNCTLFNSFTDLGYANLLLDDVNNGLLINNTCYDGRSGIYLDNNSDNNTIVENNLRDHNVNGIYLWDYCNRNKISNNILTNNDYHGIYLKWYSDNNTITDNIIKYTGWGTYDFDDMSGIYIQNTLLGMNISGNEITNNNRHGIYIYNLCYDTIIKNNNISENSYSAVKMDTNIFRTIIADNLIMDNGYGINIDDFGSQDSEVYLNKIVENDLQAIDNGQNNEWDNGSIGNFWSNYLYDDDDDDGIGDTPHDISGTAGSQDNYPIWHDSPNIKILSPQPSEIFESSAPPFNVSITDPNLESMWYTLNNGIQKVLFTKNESVNQALWDAASDGPNFITFYANDSVGNVNSSSITVIKDTGAPNIQINNPNLNDLFANTPPAFNVEIKDYLLNKTWYTVEGAFTKYFFIVNESIDTNGWNNAPEGLVAITFYANDTLGKLNSATVSVYKDTVLPIISITSPQTGAEFNVTAPNFIVEFDEANPVEMWYTLNGSLTNYTFTVNGTINQAAWDALPEGELTLKFYIEDIAGNIASNEEYIIKKIPPTDGDNGDNGTTEPEIPGYPLILLITTIWIMSTIILVIIKKNIEKI